MKTTMLRLPTGVGTFAARSKSPSRDSIEGLSSGLGSTGTDPCEPRIERDPEMSPRDWVVFLLHTAAEVEHALLVQYLYAYYSAPNEAFEIRTIATEEMGHLLTLQNVLAALGAPANFEREDFPYRSTLYPFPFVLEPLTIHSLAKYVVAESPVCVPFEELGLDPKRWRDIVDIATQGSGGTSVNHVGTLYDTLIDGVEALKKSDFVADSAQLQEADKIWFSTENPFPPRPGETGVIVMKATDQTSALAALESIAQQGEATGGTDKASHFLRFLKLYDDGARAEIPLATNPTVRIPRAGQTPILDPVARLWAVEFNVRYRWLLLSIAHFVSLPSTEANAEKTLRRWGLEDMRVHMSNVAAKLSEYGSAAGPTFELPYTLQIPTHPPHRWEAHRNALRSSVAERLWTETGDAVAKALKDSNDERERVLAQLP